MLRNKNLIPLSRQHQHALALCVRIERASPISKDDLAAWQEEIAQFFASETSAHFSVEEKVIFPVAIKFAELKPLVHDLLLDHGDLKEMCAAATEQTMSSGEIVTLAKRLSEHIRKEERQLFERMQQLMSPEELAALGKQLDLAWTEFPVLESCQISFSQKKRPRS